NELNTADRAKALQVFQTRTPSKMLAASVIGAGAGGTDAKVVFVNRGSAEGVQRGMAVVTPDGIVGKVSAAYPTASEVLLVPRRRATCAVPAPAGPAGAPGWGAASPTGTEADKLRSVYKSVGCSHKHTFGEGPPGTKPPDFTKLPSTPLPPGGPPAPATKSA